MNEQIIEKQIFTYPILFKLIFRYGNIIVTPILLLYTIPLIYFLSEKLIFVLPLLLNLAIIYFLNRHYFNLYKILPYWIEADNEKLICNQFFLSKREVIIYYSDIESLSGGVFENKLSGIMKICSQNNFVCIGFYQRLNNSGKLATIILSKVKRELYDEVIEKLKSVKKKVK